MKVNCIQKNNIHKKGFTLLEMLVAVTLFTIITTMSIGSLVTVFDANRKTQSLRTVMENLNFTMEGISREIKFGTEYYCSSVTNVVEIQTLEELATAYGGGGDCGGEKAIAFKSQTGNLMRYQFIEDSDHMGSIEQSVIGSGMTGAFTSITAPEIDIDKLAFFVVGTNPSDTYQPRVTISMNGHTGIAGSSSNTNSSFSLQTTVSQRELDQL